MTKLLRIALPAIVLTCLAASALAMVPPPEPKFPWLKAGTVIKWNLVGAYDFVVTVKKLGTEVEFDYKMSNANGTAGTVTIKEKAFAEGTAQNNYFGGGPLVLEEKTTVWVSKKFYQALKEKKDLVINAEGSDATLKFVKDDKWTVTIEGKQVEFPVLYGETDKGQKFWLLDDPENPVICKMEISFTIELKEVTPAK